MASDSVQRFVFEQLNIRGRLVSLNRAWQQMLEGLAMYSDELMELLLAVAILAVVATLTGFLLTSRRRRSSIRAA